MKLSILKKNIFNDIIKMLHYSNSSHLGGCLSSLDIVTVLFGKILKIFPKDPSNSSRDRFILSKGHNAALIYSALANMGFFNRDLLDTFAKDNSKLSGHIRSIDIPGIEFSTGSLGHGLPVSVGIALGLKRMGIKSNVYTLISDGELNCGTTWESAMFAAHHNLDNLIVLLDNNKIQSYGRCKEIIDMNPIDKKWKSFGWKVSKTNGHCFEDLEIKLKDLKKNSSLPSLLICNTIKGNGINRIQDTIISHYKPPIIEDLKK